MIKKINKRIVLAGGNNVMTVKVKIGRKEYWRRYLIENGKVPKVAKDGLQGLVNDLLK
jgi:hypothetical protein